MSQGDLARMINVSISCLNRVEHGKRGFETDWATLLPEPLSLAVKEALTNDVDGISNGLSLSDSR
jgi:ribosome-binding protein aMBF1 (putative translation factor)